MLMFDELKRKVIDPNFCTFCGTCEAACPVYAVKLGRDQPQQVYDCSAIALRCTICHDLCPHTDTLIPELVKLVNTAPFWENDVGHYRRILLARSLDPNIRRMHQSGGVVSSLLMYMVDSNFVDGAVVSRTAPGLLVKDKPTLASVPDDMLSPIESKISPRAVSAAYGEAAYDYWKPRIAFIGTPCQVRAIRKLEAWHHRLADCLKIVIGLFCLWAFSREKLLQYLSESHSIDSANITKFELIGRDFEVYTKSGVVRIPVAEAKSHIVESCKLCVDFTSKLADISIGGAGHLQGWSIIVSRTEKGDQCLEAAMKERFLETEEIEEQSDVLPRIFETARIEKNMAIEEFKARKKDGRPFPPATERLFELL